MFLNRRYVLIDEIADAMYHERGNKKTYDDIVEGLEGYDDDKLLMEHARFYGVDAPDNK